jgi:hypothetical protein
MERIVRYLIRLTSAGNNWVTYCAELNAPMCNVVLEGRTAIATLVNGGNRVNGAYVVAIIANDERVTYFNIALLRISPAARCLEARNPIYPDLSMWVIARIQRVSVILLCLPQIRA